MIYTHAIKRGSLGVIRLADHLYRLLQVDIGSDNHCSP